MKFSYHKIALPRPSAFFGTSILKPIIPIEILHGSKSIKYAALIDSGADLCIFDAEVADYLGIDVRSGEIEKFKGIQESGQSTAYIHNVKIVIGGYDYYMTVAFSYEIARHGFGILGQKGFFEKFIVKFDYSKQELELKEKQ